MCAIRTLTGSVGAAFPYSREGDVGLSTEAHLQPGGTRSIPDRPRQRSGCPTRPAVGAVRRNSGSRSRGLQRLQPIGTRCAVDPAGGCHGPWLEVRARLAPQLRPVQFPVATRQLDHPNRDRGQRFEPSKGTSSCTEAEVKGAAPTPDAAEAGGDSQVTRPLSAPPPRWAQNRAACTRRSLTRRSVGNGTDAYGV